MSNYNSHSSIEQFCHYIREFGLEPPKDMQPNNWYRFPGIDKKNGNKAAWCKLFPDGFGGVFGDFSSDLSEIWQSTSNPKSKKEQELFRRHVLEARSQMEIDQKDIYLKTQKTAIQIWKTAKPASDNHPYLLDKGIKSYGLRVYTGKKDIGGVNCNESLMIPIMQDGVIHSLQFISGSKEKRFLPSGRKSGGYFLIGEFNPDSPLCMAEGYATATSIFMATGYPTVVAFDSGNLEKVAVLIRQKFPNTLLIICADDDYITPNNPGLTKATMSAKIVGARLAIPDFGDLRSENDKDFNDLHKSQGLDVVKWCIQNAKLALEMPSSNFDKIPVKFHYSGGYFEVSSDGVFHIGRNQEGEKLPPIWVCSPLRVIAKTRDSINGEWGRLLVWHDDDQIIHRWAMPLDLLQGDGLDIRKELSRLGLTIAPVKKARELLSSYLQICNVEARARCVSRLGWYGGIYVTASESIGQNKEKELVVFQNSHAIDPAFSTSGTIDEWRDNVGILISGNSRLVFATSIAFAPVLADLIGEDSGGFHFRGSSSSGKTTALKIAASIWGNPEKYLRLWRTTANGLEGLAALHNDGLLILDELSQMDPRDAGEAAYLLANGQGKTRATRNGSAKQVFRWRLLFLSAGEESLTALMARSGQKSNVGQEIRLADIEADASSNMGIFEDLHNTDSPATFALKLKNATNQYHGAVGMAWIGKVVTDRAAIAHLVTNCVKDFVEKIVPSDASGQIFRVARRFGLVAIAGELATELGLTGWNKGESIRSAQKCFMAWLDGFGGIGNRENRSILTQVKSFFETQGGSRFADINFPSDERIHNRAGFYREGEDKKREYLVLPEFFKKEICQGFDLKMVIKVLIDAGWLIPGNDNRPTQKPRVSGFGTPRCYVFNSQMWDAECETI